ncbi:MAG TPA: hypothetical protein PLF78_07665 [Caulobacter sp.]|nr:hypothetical protein [Caulobacter sp.]
MPGSQIAAASALAPIATVLVGALTTAVAGNWLVQRWQQRNWLRQQVYSIHERDFATLKELADQVASAISARLQAMRRLNYAIHRAEVTDMERCLEKYKLVLDSWNENLSIFFKNLTLYADYRFTQTLEDPVHASFVSAGRMLEQYVRNRRAGLPEIGLYPEIDRKLNDIQGLSFQYNRDLLLYIQTKDKEFKVGKRISYAEHNLHLFSDVELIKALFVPSIENHAVFRSPIDLLAPSRRF